MCEQRVICTKCKRDINPTYICKHCSVTRDGLLELLRRVSDAREVSEYIGQGDYLYSKVLSSKLLHEIKEVLRKENK